MANKWGFKMAKTLKSALQSVGLVAGDVSTDPATAGAKPAKTVSSATETASNEVLQEQVKEALITQASDPVADFQQLTGGGETIAEEAAAVIEHNEELNKATPPDGTVTGQIAAMREHVAGQATSTVLPGMGHNAPPEGFEFSSDDGRHQVMSLNENYRPGAMTYDELNQEIAKVRQEATGMKQSLQTFRDHLACLAADYMILRRNGDGVIVMNGEKIAVQKLVLARDSAAIIAERKNITSFLKSVCNYKPQLSLVSSSTKDGKDVVTTPTQNTAEISSLDTSISEAVSAGILVYFGAYGFTTADFTPSGSTCWTPELEAQYQTEGMEIHKVRRLAYQWNLLAPFFVLNKRDMPSPAELLVATSTATKLAYNALIHKVELDKYGVPLKAQRATGGETKPAETAEQKKAREAQEAIDGAAKLVKAAEAISGMTGKPGSTEPGAETAPVPADKVAISKTLLGSVVTATREVFSKVDPGSHDLALAKNLMEAATILITRLAWSSDRIKKNVELMEVASKLNMELAEVLDADADDKL